MAGPSEAVDLETNFAEVARVLFTHGSVETTLQQIVDLAKRTIEGCDGAGIFVLADGRPQTAAASDALVLTVDRLQIEAGEGPCLDALKARETFYGNDLDDDPRWPTLGPLALAAGVRCILAYTLSSEPPSVLNLYSRLPAAFGVTGRAQGVLFATLAGLALDSAEERASDDEATGNLNEALATREFIGQAQGILMERERITADQAFDVLRRASQRLNVKLRRVAEALVETGESPEVATSQPEP
ncbi:MAG: GAF and ANTAR domain-containing protein [Acidimicrobiales bacterium]